MSRAAAGSRRVVAVLLWIMIGVGSFPAAAAGGDVGIGVSIAREPSSGMAPGGSPDATAFPGSFARVCDRTISGQAQEAMACEVGRGAALAAPAVVWTSVTDGAESGLDADLLDGYTSADFLREIAGVNLTRKIEDEKLWAALTAEIDARQRALAALWDEAKRLDARVEALQGTRAALDREILERKLADAGQTQSLLDEAAVRSLRDGQLSADVASVRSDLDSFKKSEPAERIAGDAALQRDLDAERKARRDADTALSGRIGGLEGHVRSGDFRGSTLDLTAGATFGGNVGIGTSMPVAGLHVRGRAGPAATLRISGEDDGKGSNARIQFGGGEDVIAEIRSHYHNSAENGVGELQFLTRRATSDPALTPAVVILPSGNVGIGTASPAAPLHVRPPPGGGAGIVIDPPEAEADSTLKLRTAGVDRGFLSADGAHVTLRSTGFLSLHAGGLSSERVRITSAGNVGIGTADPQARLHVAGDLRTGGSATIGGNGLGVGENAGSAFIHFRTGDDDRVSASIMTGPEGWAQPRITILPGSGNVGIGTSTPGARLEIKSGLEGENEASFTISDFNNDARTYAFRIVDENTGADVFSLRSNGAGNSNGAIDMRVSGNVGIGTTAPNAKLAVVGDIKASGPISANTAVPTGDVAEPVVGEGLEPGDVVVLDGFDPTGKLRVRRAATALDPGVVGVVSTNPSLRLAGLATDVPLAVTGIVPVKVVGPVKAKDLLVASPEPGRAMACPPEADCKGAVIGKALEAWGEGEGRVRAMVGWG